VKNFKDLPKEDSITGSQAAGGRVVLCFSHLRWSFVYQRPQHLMTRMQRHFPVLFFEEPIFEERESAELRAEVQESGVEVLTPLLPHGANALKAQKSLLAGFLAGRQIQRCLAWYYTPMALEFSRHVVPEMTVYDCMDELSNFAGAPPKLLSLERELFERADVVFVGGRSLYEVKRQQHDNTYLFPSSIDLEHFSVARREMDDPEDQSAIPHPRIGFFGVLDERLDRELLASLAESHPEWQFVLIGPVVKIVPDSLPQAANLHYLGKKGYTELPRYLANWDISMLPFAMNASTRFISPTKTPEYLAAGRPVVSTPIHDVVEPYGRLGLARIAADAQEFSAAIRGLLTERDQQWLQRVDGFLRDLSWDRTFAGMWREIEFGWKKKTAGISVGQCGREEEAHV
jgi:glycosyltransferase involved in cell wall biosynthesis